MYVQEIHPPKAVDFILTTDHAYAVIDMFRMEMTMLETLTWNLYSQTPIAFVTLILRLAAATTNYDVHALSVQLLTDRSHVSARSASSTTATSADSSVGTAASVARVIASASDPIEASSSSPSAVTTGESSSTSTTGGSGAGSGVGVGVDVDVNVGADADAGAGAGAGAGDWQDTPIVMVLQSLLSVEAFCRITELLDLVLLHPISLQWPASLLAAAVVVTVHPWVWDLLPRICPHPSEVHPGLSSLSRDFVTVIMIHLTIGSSYPTPSAPRPRFCSHVHYHAVKSYSCGVQFFQGLFCSMLVIFFAQ
jgi:hypothetical protein